MKSKQSILSAIRKAAINPIDEPSLDHDWITFDDLHGQFEASLELVGGHAVFVESQNEINQRLAGIPAYADAKRVYSSIDGVGQSNVRMNEIDDPHELEDVDFAILTAEFGVAENAALWVTGQGLKHRVIYFIPQHLALVVPADQIVNNMHEAYKRLSFRESGFGVFISGPSKTADIEQSLVIGAHGPRSLTVFLV